MQTDALDQLANAVNTRGLRAGVTASAEVSLATIAAYCKRREQAWQHVHAVPILGGVSSPTSGVAIDFPDLLGPHDGYWWMVYRITATGFSAGSVAVYRNSPSGEQLGNITAAGVQVTFGNRQCPLAPRDRLVFVPTGVTGNVQLGGNAVEVQSDYWPDYIF